MIDKKLFQLYFVFLLISFLILILCLGLTAYYKAFSPVLITVIPLSIVGSFFQYLRLKKIYMLKENLRAVTAGKVKALLLILPLTVILMIIITYDEVNRAAKQTQPMSSSGLTRGSGAAVSQALDSRLRGNDSVNFRHCGLDPQSISGSDGIAGQARNDGFFLVESV